MLRQPVSHESISPLLLSLSALSLIRLASALSVNRSIDDENGDSVTGAQPVYGPSTGTGANWFQGLLCVHCTMLPNKVVDVSQTFGGTWHDSTYHPGDPDHTLDAAFTGTAIYVYFIVPNFVAFTTTLVNLSFSIDGTYYNQYEHIPDLSTSTIMYKTLVFHTTNLANMDHNIQVRAGGDNASLLLFDNMIYTVEEADPVPSTSPTVITSPISPTVLTFQSPQTMTSSSSSSEHSPNPQAPTNISLPTTDPSSPTGAPIKSLSSSSGTPPTSHSSLPSLPRTGHPTPPTPSTSLSISPPGGPSTPALGAASSSTGIIAGGVAGGVMVLALLLLVLFCYLRRRRHQTASPAHVQRWVKKIRKPVRVRTSPSASDGSLRDVAHVAQPSSPPETRATSPTLLRGSSAWSARPHCASLSTNPQATDIKTEEDVAIHAVHAVPPRSASAYTSSSYTGVSTLRAQVAVLQGELERIRHVEEEMHQLFIEPPPRYEDL